MISRTSSTYREFLLSRANVYRFSRFKEYTLDSVRHLIIAISVCYIWLLWSVFVFQSSSLKSEVTLAIPNAFSYMIYVISPECIVPSCELSHIQLFWWIFKKKTTIFNKEIFPYYALFLQGFSIGIFQQVSLESAAVSFLKVIVIVYFSVLSKITISDAGVSPIILLIFNKRSFR